ncbi:ubiquitin carboxyl-terminal hydrolase 16-like [Olea europaea var. sylvestris]|uniref:ubiquitin carboxyl-terminal hydrolase 16-like n=1 Tax=Olea europaea var. sylvestris TaxID=158386 RepID=UPI000C1D0E1A|nr:ubiquitin carboxyl-terminal hydrolase 16-like [Olea europaea var. sylvestris]
MLLEVDLGFLYRLVAAALVLLFGPVGWLVVRQKWQHTLTRKDEIRRLLALASDEAARAEFEAAAGYSYVYSHSSPVAAEPEEETAVSVSGSSPVRQSQYQCEVCFSPTTTRCKQCKAVHYCSGKCQIIHWRQGHKDECHPCNITDQNIDVGVQSCLKEFKQDEVESSGNFIGNQGKNLAKPVDSSFLESTFIKPSLHEVPNGKDSTQVQNAVDEKQNDVTLMASSTSLPDECSPSTVLWESSVPSGENSNDSSRYDRQTTCTNMERRKSISLEEPIMLDFTDDVATIKPNEFKSSCIDLDNQSGSSTSSGWSGSGSEEHSFSESSTPSSGFWEGTIDPIKSKIDALDQCGDVKVPNCHPSVCFSIAARINVRPVEGLSSNANRNMAGDPHPSTSVPKKSTDAAPLSKEAHPYVLNSRIPPLISSKTSNSNDVQNISTEPSSNLRESKCSSSSAYCARTASSSEKNFPSANVMRDSSLQSLTPDVLSKRTEDTSRISKAVKFIEVDSRTSKVAGTQFFSSTKKPVPNALSVKIGRAHGVDACSSQCGCLSQKARFDTNISVRILDPLRDSNLMWHSSLDSRSDAMGRFKGLFPYDLFVKLYNWNKVELRPCGLINCGNSCYANAVLQCLAFTPPLTAYFLQGLHSKACRKKDWCFTCEFETLVSKARESYSPFSPIRIVSQLQNIGSHLANGREEDAHEFLRCAIDSMQVACLKESEIKEPSPLDEETTLMGLTFGGYLRSKIECMRCGGKSERHERMMDLTVEIGGDIGTLEEAIEQFTHTETLDGENKYHCSRCRSYEKAKKKLRVLEAPNVLTVVLKRFQADKFGKLNKRIKFPEILNMAPYMSGTSDKSPIYQLYGVVVHLDVMNATFSGHYVCYIKNNHGRWFKVDDSTVQVVELEKVLTKNAYMLLYARCSPRAPRLIRSSIVPHDTRKARHPTWKSRAHSADGQDVSTSELNVQKCNDFPFCCTSFQPIRSILEDDRMSENSSFFSEVGSYSTESTSTNMESTGTDDNFDQIFGDTGICWNRLSRNSTDSDTASSSSSPSPLHSRHSPLADFDYSSSECPETCCPCAESAVDRPGFWAGEGRGSLVCRKHFRKPVDSSSSSCREPGANKLGQNYDDMKFTSVSCSRRFTRERVD